MTYEFKDHYVTVCTACRTSACWLGVFMCQQSRDAGTVDVLASALREENRENPEWYSVGTLMRHCGSVKLVGDCKINSFLIPFGNEGAKT